MFKPNKNIESEILQVVAESGFGLNISTIAFEVDILRTTAKRHLERLTREGKVVEHVIGRSRVFAPAKTAKPELMQASTPAKEVLA